MLKSLLSTRTRIVALIAMIMIFTSLGGLVSAQYAGKEFRGWFFNMKKLSSAEVPTNAQIASAPGYVAFYLDSTGVPKFKTSAGVVTTITTGGSSALTANTFIVAGTAGAITSKSAATNGQILIGSTGAVPALAAITGTSNQVTVTNGAGTITLSTPQSIHTAATPTFASLTLSGLTANSFAYSGAAGLITATAAPTNGQLLVGSTGSAPVAAALTGTSNQVVVTNGAGSITLSTPQSIHTAATPTFASLTLSGLTVNSFTYSGTAGLLTATAAPTNGQLLVGSTGAAPVAAALTGTADQITVTNGAGSITLSTPQSIAVGSSPTFTALTLSGLTANSFSYSGTAGLLTTTAAPTNGQLLIGSTGVAPVVAGLTGTADQITVTTGAGSITLSTPQSIATTSDVTFNTVIGTVGLQASAVARTATADGLTTGTVADRTSFVAVTSADANNIIVLPTPTPGITVKLAVAATGYELRSSAPATVAINGGVGAAAESAIAANVLTSCTCTSATTWICMDQSSAGLISATQVAAP